MVLPVSLMVFWAVFTPLAIFLVAVPGYVIATYFKHRLDKTDYEKSGKSRLVSKNKTSCSTTYYASIRPNLKDKLQPQARMIVPSPIKSITKHLRSASTQLPSTPVKQNYHLKPIIKATEIEIFKKERRNSSPGVNGGILTNIKSPPDILDLFTLHHIQPAKIDSTNDEKFIKNEKISEKNEEEFYKIIKSEETSPTSGHKKKQKHLSPILTASVPLIVPISQKYELNIQENRKIDMPEFESKS